MELPPDTLFDSAAEAEAVCARLNSADPGLSDPLWSVRGTAEGRWRVVRERGFAAADVGGDPAAYERALRAALERSAGNHDFWRDAEGIRIEAVSLEGTYPATQLVWLFRAVPSPRTSFGRPKADCLFGIRWPIWPTEEPNPEQQALAQDMYFMEALGTDPRVYNVLRGGAPCDPDTVNWLIT